MTARSCAVSRLGSSSNRELELAVESGVELAYTLLEIEKMLARSGDA